MVLCLLLALFMPDIWVVCGVNNNTIIDTVLTSVMAMFTLELLLLSIFDASYLFSFFQLMDLVGTISMIFDISYMGGFTDHTVPYVSTSDSDAQKNLMLLRATRAARVGARAGRLSRVLRILRFLPFLSSAKQNDAKTGIASLISSQLANLLATRVACLTIILVMIIPLFDMWTFPQNDYSLQAWVDRLSKNSQEGRNDEVLRELQLMSQFYSRYDYGPFTACIGSEARRDGNVFFDCDPDAVDFRELGWAPLLSGPTRPASIEVKFKDNFSVSFNMHNPTQLKGGMAMATTTFIIIIMVFSGLALSNVVTELAVRPLERMLNTVRKIASTVFKFSANIQDDAADDDMVDIDSSNEMKLLEKVVQKLAIIADLQTAKNIKPTDDMRDEDIGILSMMHGKNIAEEAKTLERKSMAAPKRRAGKVPTVRLEDFGVANEVYHSWGFNALPLTKKQRIALTVYTISRFHDAGEGFVQTAEDVQLLQRFVTAVEREYLPVPFHSFAHAVDVTHATSRLMQQTCSDCFLDELEQYALLIAAVAHDLGHPGVNNGFLSEVGHDLALQYNDRAPLENMHCAKLYSIVGNAATNVFSKLTKEQYVEARKICVETILHTDMMVHQAMVKDLQMVYQMNTELFQSRVDRQGSERDAVTSRSSGPSAAETAVFSQPETKLLVLETILHSADVSNPCRIWQVTEAWAMVCLEEFFAQGDQEKMLGIPVQFLNDRDKLNKPNSQIGFIEFMIAPFIAAQIRIWPAMEELGNNLCSNLMNWEDLWVKETSPGEEERQKVRSRVEKVKANLQDAVMRTPVQA